MSKEKEQVYSPFRAGVKKFFKNPFSVTGLVVLVVLVLFAVIGPMVTGYDQETMDMMNMLKAPTPQHLLGTDDLGRDILTRLACGGRVSISVGVFATMFKLVIGVLLGSIAGYYGGRTDNIIMRILDVFMSVPGILLSLSIAAALGPGLFNLMIAVGIGSVPGYARIVRASILSVKEQEYIEAAHCIGCSNARIIFRHVLPNCLAPIIVQATLGVASAILVASSMSFLGLGLEPPIPEWGAMLSVGRPYIRDYWHLVAFPGMAIMITVFSLNVFGDGLRDALDPRLKQ